MATPSNVGHDWPPATDLGYVLHKNPNNVRTVSTAVGPARVFWPEADPEQATVATFVDVDPIGLVRRGGSQPLAAYVNDRPYVASSFLSVAIGRLFRSAMNGDCPARPELVDHRWPVVVGLPATPIGGHHQLVEQLFQPLGYETTVRVPELDDAFPEWGSASVAEVTLRAEITMRDLLRHLYVLLPVLDNDKHYWVDEKEVAKLLRHGAGWLADHPEHALITRRYLGNYGNLTRLALDGLADQPARSGDSGPEPANDSRPVDDPEPAAESNEAVPVDAIAAPTGDGAADADEAMIERPLSLNDQRLAAVIEAVLATSPHVVADLGCGEGNLMLRLAEERSIDRLIGADVSLRALKRTGRRLRLDQRPERQKPSVELRHSSLTYRDTGLADLDVACLIEVIEHLDPPRLDAVEPIIFAESRPKSVIVTTPNREYNALFNLSPGALRHRDHRFEWTRAEFTDWCRHISASYDYDHTMQSIGPVDPERGAPTQMAVFSLRHSGDDHQNQDQAQNQTRGREQADG